MDIIKHIFDAATQYIREPMSALLKRHFRSPCLALNVRQRKEAAATDTIRSDVPAIASGATQAQFYYGQ